MLQGALRIHYAQPGGQNAPPAAPPSDDYLKQLTLLFPAEMVSIYAAGLALMKPDQPATVSPYLWWFTLLCAVAVILLRVVGTKPKGGGATRYVAVTISLISFLLWAVSVGGWLIPGSIPTGARLVASLIALVWTVIAPIIAQQFP